MKTRIDETIERHSKGYNCAQAVACTYADLVDLDEKTVFRLTEALGAGMGNMEGTCGAVSGACILAGLKNSSGNMDKPDSKGSSYRLARKILDTFKEKNGSITCKELKGIETGKMLCPCSECIREAARLAEEIVFNQ